jgi:hypothetical protein
VNWNTIIMLAGDFNANHPNLSGTSTINTAGRLLERFAAKNALTQVIKEPTRLTLNSSSCLDLILTNIPEHITSETVYPPMGTSDHGVARVSLSSSPNQVYRNREEIFPRLYFNTRYTDWQAMNDSFSNVDWDDILSQCTAEECWTVFKLIYEDVLKQFARKPRRVPDANQMRSDTRTTQHLAQLRALRQRAWRLHSTAKTPQTYEGLIQAREAYAMACEDSECRENERIVQNMIESNNEKSWHKFCKQLYRGTAAKEAIPTLSADNHLFTGPKEKATLLNHTFVTKAGASARSYFPSLPRKTDCIVSDIHFGEYRVKETLRTLDASKAAGPDGIQPIVLKKCHDSLNVPLAVLFNKSFEEGTVPKEWKLAAVVPVYKNKGQRTDPQQYRPISLTSCVGKVMERLINDALLQHLTKKGLITNNQFGFRPGHSATDEVTLLLHELLTAVADRKSAMACFLDLAAAFDSVPHPAIFQKLPAYGIRGFFFRWLQSYLSDRKQYVVVDGSASPTSSVSSGVPQGSVIAPTLFLLFINDLCLDMSALQSTSYPNCQSSTPTI